MPLLVLPSASNFRPNVRIWRSRAFLKGSSIPGHSHTRGHVPYSTFIMLTNACNLHMMQPSNSYLASCSVAIKFNSMRIAARLDAFVSLLHFPSLCCPRCMSKSNLLHTHLCTPATTKAATSHGRAGGNGGDEGGTGGDGGSGGPAHSQMTSVERWPSALLQLSGTAPSTAHELWSSSHAPEQAEQLSASAGH